MTISATPPRPLDDILLDLSLACFEQANTWLQCSTAIREALQLFQAGDTTVGMSRLEDAAALMVAAGTKATWAQELSEEMAKRSAYLRN